MFEKGSISAGAQARLGEGKQSPLALTLGPQRGAGDRQWVRLPGGVPSVAPKLQKLVC